MNDVPRDNTAPGTYRVVGGGVLRGNNYMIEARDVRKSFGRTLALRGATVAAAPGEILAIMGPSGSGKSTLLHCLAGIFPPDEGEVWFGGTRLDARSEAARTRLRRTAFGFVFQFGQLVPELTAADNAGHRHPGPDAVPGAAAGGGGAAGRRHRGHRGPGLRHVGAGHPADGTAGHAA